MACCKCKQVALEPRTIDPCSHLICTLCLLHLDSGKCPICSAWIVDAPRDKAAKLLVRKEMGDATYIARLEAVDDELFDLALSALADRNPLDIADLVSGEVHLE